MGSEHLVNRLESTKEFFDRSTRCLQEGDSGFAPIGVTYLNHASIGTVPTAVQWAHREYLDLCETNPWCGSPTDWSLGASLVAIEDKGKDRNEVASRLFADHGIVVRPFVQPGLNALRVSPNLANSEADLDRLLDAI